ncbi:MAG: (Fe-S)-binding protein [Thermoguttaceae bacterium]|jgi:Fe-S oxidoreductase|nr:(Fe-S)-binding protein [Thermoguttaceae bacterium]MDI9445345.1 (Fe-S)-binding protein [Planctomycetota bacterium]
MLITDHAATIEACRFCFMCRHVCTLGVVSGRESDTPRGKGLILSKILKGHADYGADLVDTLYRCCLCGLCETWCKAGCRPPAAVLAARADIVAQGKAPEQVRQIKERLVQTGNPFGLPPGERFQALEGPDLFRARAEVLYYAGCDTAYRQPRIAQALLKIFRAAEADFTLLAGERSTGKPLSLLGYPAEARAMAEDLAGQIRATRCRTLVTGCPSSFDAFTRDYPAMGLDLGGIEVLHAAQYLDRLLAEGRLAPLLSAATSATLLDGTYLGRTHGIFDPPRRVLGKLAGLDLREMTWTRELAYSAGEPGGVFQLLQPELSRQVAARVLEEAAKTGAAVLATTCPATKTALAEVEQASLEVLDVAEILAQTL